MDATLHFWVIHYSSIYPQWGSQTCENNFHPLAYWTFARFQRKYLPEADEQYALAVKYSSKLDIFVARSSNFARCVRKQIFIHSFIELSLVFKENICLRQMNNMHSLQNIQASLIYLLHEVPTSLVAYENKFSSTRL